MIKASRGGLSATASLENLRHGRRPPARHRHRVPTNTDIVVKYRSLTRSVIPIDRQTAIGKTVFNLETLDDVSELIALLTPTVRSRPRRQPEGPCSVTLGDHYMSSLSF